MSEMTAEQAAEAAKGLTFEKVWAMIMETRRDMQKSMDDTNTRMVETFRQMKESNEDMRRQMKESNEDTRRQMKESFQETRKQLLESSEEARMQMQETQKVLQESQQKNDRVIADLSKNIGGLGNTMGKYTEAMFGPELWKKFNKFGFAFTKQGPDLKFIEYGRVFAEVDFFLENGDYAMPVEIKTELSVGDIDEHLKRIEKIRSYMDSHDDGRKLVGAVAGGIVSENVRNYAQKKGLFVIVKSGDTVAIADIPEGFKAREWISASAR